MKLDELIEKEFNTPNRAVFISWSCSPKAAVPFRGRLSAVIARSCWAPLMLLPLASKTMDQRLSFKPFLTGFNRNPGHVTQTARLSRCGDTPFFCHPLHSSWVPPSLLPLFYCSLFCSAFSGDSEGREICNKLWVLTQNQRFCMLSGLQRPLLKMCDRKQRPT